MKVWRRASGAIKDKTSLWMVAMGRRSPVRNPDLESAIIRATSHDEQLVDYRNAHRVLQWIRTSPCYFKPLTLALSRRVSRTRSWVVALKSLILLHGVLCCDVPAIRRLPFDLSNFLDACASPATAFVRAYFAFLDQRAACLSPGLPRAAAGSISMGQELVRIQKWQALLDLLLRVKPDKGGRGGLLVLEAMDCVIIEIFDIYSSICSGIAAVLVRLSAATSSEASVALRVLKKASAQSETLSQYFQSCRDIGVLNSSELPPVERIPEDDIREVEQIISDVSMTPVPAVDVKSEDHPLAAELSDTRRRRLQANGGGVLLNKSAGAELRPGITDEWEVFDDDRVGMPGFSRVGVGVTAAAAEEEDLESALDLPLTGAPGDETQPVHANSEGLPDLIAF